MDAITHTLSPADLETTAGLQLLARQVVEGFCTGRHRAPHKGSSVEFKQHRQYVAGDELRHLDWKVFGKSDRLFIREYEEETNLRATLLLDCSGSMGYRDGAATRTANSRTPSKHAYAVRLAACLTYLMLRQQDSVGLVTFDERLRKMLPPRSRPGHARVLIETMANSQPAGESGLEQVFQTIAPKLHRRGLLLLVSDCFCDVDRLMKGLAQLRRARHEVIVFQIWSREELDFPFDQWTRFDCLESSGHHHLVDPAHLRAAYLENLANFRDQLQQGCNRHRIDLVPLVTDEPLANSLAHYAALRTRTLKRGR